MDRVWIDFGYTYTSTSFHFIQTFKPKGEIMAKVFSNMVMQGLSGLLGNQLVIRQDKAGRTIITARPRYNPNRAFSEAQKQHHNDFREAAAYARSARGADIYVSKAAGTPLNPYNVALADWFHAPEILEMDLGGWSGQPGKVIRVKALDDVLVTQVMITIRDGGGALLEQGPATSMDALWWEYTTRSTASGRLTVTAAAQDMPGNITEMSKTSA